MPEVYPGVACNLDKDILLATMPLFDKERVEAIEWSFDTLYKIKEIPEWFLELLGLFSKEGRLVGHGVFFSLFNAKWAPEQQQWLDHLKKLADQFPFDHLTEHFGFMSGKNFHTGAPLPIPLTKTTLALGQDRLNRIQQAAQCPVGLENLALAFSMEDVKTQGDFLHQLIAPFNGFIILDLHNLYCQIHNFDVSFEEIIQWYPLDRVREIHISGGSWQESSLFPGKKIRRDTHDEAVPGEVMDLLKKAMPLCPNLRFVILEQLGHSMHSPASKIQFQTDFYNMYMAISTHNISQNTHRSESSNSFLPQHNLPAGPPLEEEALYRQQRDLARIMETAFDYREAAGRLRISSLGNSAWRIEDWEPSMIETALQIVKKWKKGFA